MSAQRETKLLESRVGMGRVEGDGRGHGWVEVSRNGGSQVERSTVALG